MRIIFSKRKTARQNFKPKLNKKEKKTRKKMLNEITVTLLKKNRYHVINTENLSKIRKF